MIGVLGISVSPSPVESYEVFNAEICFLCALIKPITADSSSVLNLRALPDGCNNISVISECKCDSVPFQLQNNPAQARA